MANEIVSIGGGITPQDVLKYVESGGTYKISVVADDPADIAERINAEILGASSPAELFGDKEVLHGRDYLNNPFQLVDVEYRPSEIDGEGMPFYGVFHIVTTDGEIKVLTTGARSVLLKAAKAQYEGWLPLWVKLTQSEKKTEAGYQPLDLAQAPEGF